MSPPVEFSHILSPGEPAAALVSIRDPNLIFRRLPHLHVAAGTKEKVIPGSETMQLISLLIDRPL